MHYYDLEQFDFVLANVEENLGHRDGEPVEAASVSPELQSLFDTYGPAYFLDKDGKVTAVGQRFWAGLLHAERIQLYEPDEKNFFRYYPECGLYQVISEDAIKSEVAARMLEVSHAEQKSSLVRKSDNATLKSIVDLSRGVSERRGAFPRDRKIMHVANGVLVFKDNHEADLCEFSPVFMSRNQCPISFDSKARCDRFLNEFVYPALTADDAILFQKYFGMCLLGTNLIQKFLILQGEGGEGKSMAAALIQRIVGPRNVTQLRTKHLEERFELYRYRDKTLISGVDVPGDFLNVKGASVLKGLVGGDCLDAEKKGGTDSYQFQGNFNVIITSNCSLRLRLNSDAKAWRRRLMIIRFEGKPPAKQIPHFEELLVKTEGSGILNWALVGLQALLRDVEAQGDIFMSERQQAVIDELLEESDSLRNFLKARVSRSEGSDVTAGELEEAYSQYCRRNEWKSTPLLQVRHELEGLMLELFQTSKANSISRNGRDAKGYRNVGLANEEEGEESWD